MIRVVIAATVETPNDRRFPVDVAVFEAETRIDALRQADKLWPKTYTEGHFAGKRRGLKVVDADPDPAIPPVAPTVIYRQICAWCPTVLVEGDPGAPVSHGICEDCAKSFESHQAETEAIIERAPTE